MQFLPAGQLFQQLLVLDLGCNVNPGTQECTGARNALRQRCQALRCGGHGGHGGHHGFHGGHHGGGHWGGHHRGWSGPRIGIGIGLGLGAGAAYGYYGGGHNAYRGYGGYNGYGGGWRPRVGVYVPVLPPVYSTWYHAGSPYYYADGVYYAPGSNSGYTVVEPPPGGDLVAGTAPPKGPPEPVVYPRNQQSAEQTERDRQDCNRWATGQPNAVADASVFQRAAAACLDARGYTVR